jgi:hypothetical protein
MIRFAGRTFSDSDINLMKQIISEDPDQTRLTISKKVSQALNWTKRSGGYNEMSCRVALLRLFESNLISLPKPRRKNGNGQRYKTRTLLAEPGQSLSLPVHQLSIQFQIVDRHLTNLWNEYIDRYHYLGFATLPGAQIRYFISHNQIPIAMMGFSAAAWQTAPRDSFIGWSHVQRDNKLHLVVNNARFLILPWVSSKNLASKLLSMASKRLPLDWKNKYGYSPVLLETFVHDSKFKGIAYKAANWIYVGKTKGRGRNDKFKDLQNEIKSVWLFPLSQKFKSALMI